ncbi:MAG: YciI family protein [Pseudooceanicola nanhaiensis]|uniref:YciI family protein n=1 Tax=Rhodobacterales TaxID=204455 RepID=UPI004059E7E3
MIYVCPSKYLGEIPADALSGHREWLQSAVAEGTVLSAGRREDGSGGVVILTAETADAAREVLSADPFVQAGLAEYETIGFTPGLGPLFG